MVGLGTEDIIGTYHYDLLPHVPEYFKDAHRRALQGEVVHKDDDRIELPDGSIHWNSWEVRPWKTADGTIGGIIIFSEEVTERKEAEIALKENEALLSEVGGIAKIGGWEYEVETATSKLTPDVYKIYDLEPDSSTDIDYTLGFYLPSSRKIIGDVFLINYRSAGIQCLHVFLSKEICKFLIYKVIVSLTNDILFFCTKKVLKFGIT
jgi:PAS domain S-box-containing protein